MNEITRQQAIEQNLRDVADGIKFAFPDMGFALIVFDFHKPGVGNYISNAARDGIIKTLRETADRLEQKKDMPPAGMAVH